RACAPCSARRSCSTSPSIPAASRARGPCWRADRESEGEAARQRIVRRADALGWFLTENGRRVRFLVDDPDWDRVEPAVQKALGDSGLGLAPSPGGLEA